MAYDIFDVATALALVQSLDCPAGVAGDRCRKALKDASAALKSDLVLRADGKPGDDRILSDSAKLVAAVIPLIVGPKFDAKGLKVKFAVALGKIASDYPDVLPEGVEAADVRPEASGLAKAVGFATSGLGEPWITQRIYSDEPGNASGMGAGYDPRLMKNVPVSDWGIGAGYDPRLMRNVPVSDWGIGAGYDPRLMRNVPVSDWGIGAGYDPRLMRNVPVSDWGIGQLGQASPAAAALQSQISALLASIPALEAQQPGSSAPVQLQVAALQQQLAALTGSAAPAASPGFLASYGKWLLIGGAAAAGATGLWWWSQQQAHQAF